MSKSNKNKKKGSTKFSFIPLLLFILITAAMFLMGFITGKKAAYNPAGEEITMEQPEDHVHEDYLQKDLTEPDDALEESIGEESSGDDNPEEESLYNPIQMGDNIWYTLYADGTLLVTGTGSTWDFDLPGDVTAYLMEQLPQEHTNVKRDWFYAVKNIVIDAGVTELGKNALASYTDTESVTCFGQLESIRENAFRNCGTFLQSEQKTTWNVDFTKAKIEDGAFNSCPNPPVECKTTRLPGTNNAPVDEEEPAEQS